MGFPEHVDHVLADPLALLLCLSNGSIWALRCNSCCCCSFSLRWHQKGSGFTAKGLGQSPSPFWYPWHESFPPFPFSSFPAALDEQRVSRRGWGRKSCLQHWRWLQPVPAGPVWVLCIGRSRGASLVLKSPSTPHRLYVAVSHPLPIIAEHHRPTLPQTFPYSLWPSCPGVPLIHLSHTFFSWNPFAHLPQKKKAPPQCQHGFILDAGKKSLICLHAVPPPHLQSPELNQTTAQACSACGDRGPPHLGWALLSSLPILARSTLHLCCQPWVKCVRRDLTWGNCPVTILSLPN